MALVVAAREVHGMSDAELAHLARCSVLVSRAPEAVRRRLLAGIDAWLRDEKPGGTPTSPRGPGTGVGAGHSHGHGHGAGHAPDR